MKVLQRVKNILAVIGLVALCILTGSFLFKKKDERQTDKAQKVKEDKKNEIENTPACDLVAAADNANELCGVKDGIKSDFRERIRNRLKQELQRLGSITND